MANGAQVQKMFFDVESLSLLVEEEEIKKSVISSSVSDGMEIQPLFTQPGIHPFDELEWEKRDATIVNEKGDVIFEQKDVEMPAEWSQMATNVVVSKYFSGTINTPERETSLKHLIDRVARTITNWGKKDHIFYSEKDADTFYNELIYILVNQHASFNSPVWFNVGIEEKPQCSACFINSVKDTMSSILNLAKTEGMLFKWGSGTGTNLSPIRSSYEKLSGGGVASGPVSFMRGFDAFAGVIKSGGKTRRAAKMVILNVDHPDIMEFITCKAREEKKAWTLIENGYDGSIDGEVYTNLFFQNANNSVRVTDEFMEAVIHNNEWHTRSVMTGEVIGKYQASDLMKAIAENAHLCGDPGMQFHTTINKWNTCPNTAPINASNPCSEFMFLDDSACNLSSINLMKYLRDGGTFDIESFLHTVKIMFLAQEIIVDNASYPTPEIEKNSRDYRPIGLGYANLGALLMALGYPYSSPEARAMAGAITAIMSGQAYKTSAEIASKKGTFAGFSTNREPMIGVMQQHRKKVDFIEEKLIPEEMCRAAKKVWDEAIALGKEYGYRNAQATVLAPTGTIGFMMDCDTTGIEPDIALIKYKRLVGRGVLKLINNTVPMALKHLGYSPDEIQEIVNYISENETIEGAPNIKESDLPVFDCALKPKNGERSIHYMSHILMLAAVQPFISGAISKTVNMPESATPEDIYETYITGWKLGLKAIAIYRENSKRTQPLSTSLDNKRKLKPVRRRLPDERRAITHKFSIAGHEGYITVGMFEDGSPGEIFIVMAKEGSVVSGLMDSFATAVSITLQYGVPLETLVDKFSHTRFEPSGYTTNRQIPIAKSVMDYIFRWLSLKFLTPKEIPEKDGGITNFLNSSLSEESIYGDVLEKEKTIFNTQADAPPCYNCGEIMIRNGSCYKCLNCGSTSGCS